MINNNTKTCTNNSVRNCTLFRTLPAVGPGMDQSRRVLAGLISCSRRQGRRGYGAGGAGRGKWLEYPKNIKSQYLHEKVLTSIRVYDTLELLQRR